MMGASYGAGNYGMNGRAYDPRFLFTWPSAKSAVMGPAQLAGVLEIVARAAAEAEGRDLRRGGRRRACARWWRQQIEEQSLPYVLSGMLYDDGVIDPRDTRTVLGICLSVIDNRPDRRHRPVRGVPDVSATMTSQTPRRQPRRDRPPGLRAPAAGSASRPSPSTPTPTPALPFVARGRRRRAPARATRPPRPTCAATSSSRRPGGPAPTRSTPATASCPRTPTSPAPSRRPG